MDKLHIRLTYRFTALLLALSIGLPSPAAALRDLNARESAPKRTGLEESLRPTAAGLEETTLPQLIGTPPFPVRVLIGHDRKEAYAWDASAGHVQYPQIQYLGETVRRSMGHDYATRLDRELIYHLTTATPEEIRSAAAPAARSALMQLKGLIDEAGVVSADMSVQAAFNHLAGPFSPDGTPSYASLVGYVNRALQNEGNPRKRLVLPPLQGPEEITSLDLWGVKEGHISQVFQAEVRLRNGGSVRLAINVAKDQVDAAAALRRAHSRMRQDYARDPTLIVEPYGLGVGVASARGVKVEVPVFVTEWLDGFHELHLYPEDNGLLSVWADQRDQRGNRLTPEETGRIREAIVRILEVFSGKERGSEGVALTPDLINAGDFVAGRQRDGSWQVLMVWDPREPAPPRAGLEETLEEMIRAELGEESRINKAADDATIRRLGEIRNVTPGSVKSALSGILPLVSHQEAKVVAAAVRKAQHRFKEQQAKAPPKPVMRPLETPVHLIRYRHLLKGDGTWAGDRLKEIVAAVEPDRPVVIWLEHPAPAGMPTSIPELVALLDHAFRAAPGSQAWEQILLTQPMDGRIYQTLRLTFESLSREEPSAEAIVQAALRGEEYPHMTEICRAITEIRAARLDVQVRLQPPDFDAYLEYMRSQILFATALMALGAADRSTAMFDGERGAELAIRSAGRRDSRMVRAMAAQQGETPLCLQAVVEGGSHGPGMERELARAFTGRASPSEGILQPVPMSPHGRLVENGTAGLKTPEGQNLIRRDLLQNMIGNDIVSRTGSNPRDLEEPLVRLLDEIEDPLVERWFSGMNLVAGRGLRGNLPAAWEWLTAHREELSPSAGAAYDELQAFLDSAPASPLEVQPLVEGPAEAPAEVPLLGWNDQVEAVLESVRLGETGLIRRFGPHRGEWSTAVFLRFLDEILARGVPPDKIVVVHELGAPMFSQISQMLTEAEPGIKTNLFSSGVFPMTEELFDRVRGHYGVGGQKVPIPLDAMYPDGNQRAAVQAMCDALAPLYESRARAGRAGSRYGAEITLAAAQRGISTQEFERVPPAAWLLSERGRRAEQRAINALHLQGDPASFLYFYRDHWDLFGWVTFLERDNSHDRRLREMAQSARGQGLLILDERGSAHEGFIEDGSSWGAPYATSAVLTPEDVDPGTRFLAARIREGRLGAPFTDPEKAFLQKLPIGQRLLALCAAYEPQSGPRDTEALLRGVASAVDAVSEEQAARLNPLVAQVPQRPEIQWFHPTAAGKSADIWGGPQMFFIYAWLNELNPGPLSDELKGFLPENVRTMTTANWADVFRARVSKNRPAGLEEQVEGWDDRIEQVLDAYAADPEQGAALLRFQMHGSGDVRQGLRFFDAVREGLIRRGIPADQVKILAFTEHAPPGPSLQDSVTQAICGEGFYDTLRMYYAGGGTVPLPLERAVPDEELRERFEKIHAETSQRWQEWGQLDRGKDPNTPGHRTAFSRGLADRGIPQEWEEAPATAWLLGRYFISEMEQALSATYTNGDEGLALGRLLRHQDVYGWCIQERNYAAARQIESLLGDPRYKGYLIVPVFGSDHDEIASLVDLGGTPLAASVAHKVSPELGEPVSWLRRQREQGGRAGQPFSEEEARQALRIPLYMRIVGDLLQRYQPAALKERAPTTRHLSAFAPLLDPAGLSDAELRELNGTIHGYLSGMQWPGGAMLPYGNTALAESYMTYAWLNSRGKIPGPLKELLPASLREMTEQSVWGTYVATAGLSAGLEEEQQAPASAERITPEEFARRFPGTEWMGGAQGVYVASWQAASNVRFYAGHDTLWDQLRQWLDGERAKLPEGIETHLLRLPADPSGLEAPGVIVKDWMLKLPYGQQVLPELETAVDQPLPSLPTMILFALKGAGGQVEAVIGVMTLQDAQGNTVFAYFV